MPEIQVAGNRHLVGLVHQRSLKRGIAKITAPGGGCELTPRGMAELGNQFGAQFNIPNRDEMDARFLIDRSRFMDVLTWCRRHDERRIELSPGRELQEELGRPESGIFEIPGQTKPVLENWEIDRIRFEFGRVVYQTPDDRACDNTQTDYPIYRIFYLWLGHVPQFLLSKLQQDPWFHILSAAEKQRIKNDYDQALTDDGRFLLAGNIMAAKEADGFLNSGMRNAFASAGLLASAA